MPATLHRSLVLYTDRGHTLDALELRLAAHERVAACAHSGDRRRQFVIGRLAAHAAIRRLGDHRADLWIRSGHGGAPQIASSTGDVEDIGITIAHSGRLAFACAWIAGMAPWRHIGIDVECLRRTDVARSRYAFSQRERRLLRDTGGGASRTGLFGWIAKEAAWKALRLSPDRGPDAVCLRSFDPVRGCARVELCAVDPAIARRPTRLSVRFHAVTRADGEYLLAVAVGGRR